MVAYAFQGQPPNLGTHILPQPNRRSKVRLFTQIFKFQPSTCAIYRGQGTKSSRHIYTSPALKFPLAHDVGSTRCCFLKIYRQSGCISHFQQLATKVFFNTSIDMKHAQFVEKPAELIFQNHRVTIILEAAVQTATHSVMFESESQELARHLSELARG